MHIEDIDVVGPELAKRFSDGDVHILLMVSGEVDADAFVVSLFAVQGEGGVFPIGKASDKPEDDHTDLR